MGSRTIAGLKAGVLSGLLYVVGLAVFDVMLLYALRGVVLTIMRQQFCSGIPNCSVSNVFVPFVALVYVSFVAIIGFVVVLAYAGAFGFFYDALPRMSPTFKGEVFAAATGLTFLVFGFPLSFMGTYIVPLATIASWAFFIAWTLVFGYFLGRLYKRYTKPVSIDSQDSKGAARGDAK
jgi:hypothetical protein